MKRKSDQIVDDNDDDDDDDDGGGGDLVATCTAPVNIAVIKYWGKSDESLILPINSSLSVTLNQSDLCTTTSVLVSKSLKEDRLWLNGTEEKLNARTITCLKQLRALAGNKDNNEYHFHIVSVNNFPTAAGLASSAAGFACLVYTIAKALSLTDKYSIETLTQIARQGSGSACRSLMGGFVAWDMGITPEEYQKNINNKNKNKKINNNNVKKLGEDSQARQVANENHWKSLHILILVVNDQKKHTSSTDGMKTSVDTSLLLDYRKKSIVPQRMKDMEKAIGEKDFETFAKLTMQDSNQFHACCLDTYPPIMYLNDVSRSIIHMCTEINREKIRVAYTFDAGPNAVLFVLEENMKDVLSVINDKFPPHGSDNYNNGNNNNNTSCSIVESYYRNIDATKYLSNDVLVINDSKNTLNNQKTGVLKYILHTTPGPGPVTLTDDKSCLINTETGLPL